MADPARDTALSELVARVRGLTGPVGMTEAREIALFAREQAGLKALASDYLRCALEHGDLNAAERLRQRSCCRDRASQPTPTGFGHTWSSIAYRQSVHSRKAASSTHPSPSPVFLPS
jgi:hypothetical protein